MSNDIIKGDNIPTLKEMCIKTIISYKINVNNVNITLCDEIYSVFEKNRQELTQNALVEKNKGCPLFCMIASNTNVDVIYTGFRDYSSQLMMITNRYIQYQIFINSIEYSAKTHKKTQIRNTIINYKLSSDNNKMNEIKINYEKIKQNNNSQLFLNNVYYNSVPIDFVFINGKTECNCNVLIDHVILDDDFNIMTYSITSESVKTQFENIVEQHSYQKLSFFQFFLEQCSQETRMKYIYSYMSDCKIQMLESTTQSKYKCDHYKFLGTTANLMYFVIFIIALVLITTIFKP
jgi:hypothetical protein